MANPKIEVSVVFGSKEEFTLERMRSLNIDGQALVHRLAYFNRAHVAQIIEESIEDDETSLIIVTDDEFVHARAMFEIGRSYPEIKRFSHIANPGFCVITQNKGEGTLAAAQVLSIPTLSEVQTDEAIPETVDVAGRDVQ